MSIRFYSDDVVEVKRIQLTYSKDGTAVVTFTVISRDRHDGKEFTEYHDGVYFGKMGEYYYETIKEGDMVIISGKLKKSSYEKDGKKIYKTDLLAFDIKPVIVKDNNERLPDDGIPF